MLSAVFRTIHITLKPLFCSDLYLLLIKSYTIFNATLFVVMAFFKQTTIQFGKITHLGDRNKKVQPGVLYDPLNHPLLVGPLNQTKMMVK